MYELYQLIQIYNSTKNHAITNNLDNYFKTKITKIKQFGKTYTSQRPPVQTQDPPSYGLPNFIELSHSFFLLYSALSL